MKTIRALFSSNSMQATEEDALSQLISQDVLLEQIQSKTQDPLSISLFSMQHYAANQGLSLYAQRIKAQDLKEGTYGETIVHMKQGHYVVLKSISKNAVTIFEPNKGLEGQDVVLSKEDFEEQFSGYILTSSPMPEGEDVNEQEILSIKGAGHSSYVSSRQHPALARSRQNTQNNQHPALAGSTQNVQDNQHPDIERSQQYVKDNQHPDLTGDSRRVSTSGDRRTTRQKLEDMRKRAAAENKYLSQLRERMTLAEAFDRIRKVARALDIRVSQVRGVLSNAELYRRVMENNASKRHLESKARVTSLQHPALAVAKKNWAKLQHPATEAYKKWAAESEHYEQTPSEPNINDALDKIKSLQNSVTNNQQPSPKLSQNSSLKQLKTLKNKQLSTPVSLKTHKALQYIRVKKSTINLSALTKVKEQNFDLPKEAFNQPQKSAIGVTSLAVTLAAAAGLVWLALEYGKNIIKSGQKLRQSQIDRYFGKISESKYARDKRVYTNSIKLNSRIIRAGSEAIPLIKVKTYVPSKIVEKVISIVIKERRKGD